MTSIEDLFAFYDDFGYLGILLISFIGSIIPFVPIPYFPVLITAAFNKNLDPQLISLFSAIGAVSAKLIIFYASYYGRNILSPKIRTKMLPLQRVLAKYGWGGAFVAALTPIPDDLVYIPLGLAKYSPWKFATATFSGKFLLNEIIVLGTVYFGKPFIERIISETSSPIPLVIGAILSVIVIGAMIYLSYKIDWVKVIGRWFPWAVDKSEE
ncbi:MAG TPA: VTT domain-containing protein [Nitrososphaeraceae archaeon]